MKSTLLYLMLVGIPVTILLGVIHVGERIMPPPYVGGAWVLERAEESSLDGCIPMGTSDRPLRLVVDQSGTVLELSFRSMPRTSAGARLRDGVIRANSIPTRLPCLTPLALEARPVDPERLSGRWFVPGCDTCATAPFVASRPPLVAHANPTAR